MTPLSLRLDDVGLQVEWPDSTSTFSAAHLRERCRCAECQRMVRLGGTPVAMQGLSLRGASPVGGYGVQLHFGDGHDRGIYPWVYLRELATASGLDLRVEIDGIVR